MGGALAGSIRGNSSQGLGAMPMGSEFIRLAPPQGTINLGSSFLAPPSSFISNTSQPVGVSPSPVVFQPPTVQNAMPNRAADIQEQQAKRIAELEAEMQELKKKPSKKEKAKKTKKCCFC